VALVTGANQGLGLALVAALLDQRVDGDVVYLTARDDTRGREAAASLAANGSAPAFAQLDVTCDDSVERAFAEVVEQHGGVDVLIHNAAARIHPQRDDAVQVRQFVETNNLGTTRVLRAARSALRPGARVVVMASSYGRVMRLGEPLRSHFLGEELTLEQIDQVMLDYVEAVEQGDAKQRGWPSWINIPSKVGQVAAMRVFAREIGRKHGMLVNAACPGLVDTAASRVWFEDLSAAQSPAEAAGDVVWLATLPPDEPEPYGQLVQWRRTVSFEH
jgi:carbonyl reductase 1